MSATPAKVPRRGWLEWLGLGLAGMLSFVVAAWLGGWGRGEVPDDSVVLPVERAAKPVVGKSVAATDPPWVGVPAVVQAPFAAAPSPAARMDPRVVHDPFGALNLAATGEPEPMPSASTLRVTQPRRVVQAKPLLPPAPVTAALPAVPTEPPAPMAPPLPFTVVGAIRGGQIADGQPVAFLKQQDEVLAVRPGDAVNQVYRVESITAEKIDFIYLPLKQRQSLSLAP